MTKLSSTPAGAVLVAIDMAKNRQEVLIERPEGGRRRRMTVLATTADYDGLAEQLAAIGRPIVVGFEATGNYHRTLAHRLLTAEFELPLISSVALARTREALHNGWDKNDPKDAQVILHMLRMGATQRYVRLVVLMYVRFPLVSGTWRTCCSSAGSTSAMIRCGSGRTGLIRCSPGISVVSGLAVCGASVTGAGTWTRCT